MKEVCLDKLLNPNDDAVFITIDAASRLTNLGRNTVRRLAHESKAARKIGKSFRINKQVLLEYIDSFEA